jgi:pimeloyl-ACP methyl ester carboxylesterase
MAPLGFVSSALPGAAEAPPGNCVPRYPVIFCHGMLALRTLRFRLPKHLNGFAALRQALEGQGCRALFPQVAPTGGVAARARQLREQILRETGGPVNLVAHSMGGLDCRYLITHLGLADRVRSLTTVCSPHRGTYLADWFHTHFRRRIPLLGAWEYFGADMDGFRDCQPAACQEFNERTPDVPGVSYFSYGGDAAQALRSPVLRRGWRLLEPREGPNDGMVSLASARWGEYLGTVHADHFTQIPSAANGGAPGFDALGFCWRLLGELAARGF